MKKKLMICVALIAVMVMLCFAGCGLIATGSDSLVNNGGSSGNSSSGSSSSATQVVNYENMTKEDLEAALTKLQNIADNLNTRLETLEQIVADAISSESSKVGIGAYAYGLSDCLLNITCVESQYNLGCQGTGFIISDDGYVITNNHVIYYEATVYDTTNIQRGFFGYSYGTKVVSGEYSSITATFDSDSKYFANGTAYTLEFVYREENCDLALCKIKEAVPVGEKWSSIPFFEGTVRRGDELLVLGNADGFGLSATAGLVSATNKSLSSYEDLTFIQTDAAINGGNSGGPAINSYGALIGVVNSKFVSSSIENMGFAIELTHVKNFISRAMTNKAVTVAYHTKSASTVTTQEAA
ncbi:MAG: trypsin-like peptidase domain-containing protein [Clostridia bacterium]|nr:trypsin-like peptidase domain-containing protein [Clostridia bacterium]